MIVKCRFFLSVAVFIFSLVILSPNSKAMVYEWKDFTHAFEKDIKVGGKTIVKVELPESILKKYSTVTLVIEHVGIGSNIPGSIHGGILRINDQSIFSGYEFGMGMMTSDPIRIELETKHFKPGANFLYLAPYHTGSNRGVYYTIKKLKFDIRDVSEYPATPEMQPLISKKEKEAIKPSIAEPPHDKTPPEIIITSHDTDRGLQLVQQEKRTSICGKIVDQSAIVEVLIDNKEIVIDGDGNFSAEVYLGYGENHIVISAMDRYENRATKTITIIRKISSETQVSETTKKLTGKYFALLIGNNDYQNLRKLSTAKQDAERVGFVLESRYGFEIRLLFDSTRNDIVSTLNRFRNELREDDSFLIYYAGHGEFDKITGKAYWLPVDARSDEDTNWIIVDTITSNIKRIPSIHILVIADSCYSGTFTRRAVTELVTTQERGRYLSKMRTKRSRTLLASGGNEPVSDIGGSGHSVFAKALLRGLESINHNEFTAEEIYYQYIKEMVAGSSEQTPEYNIIRNSGHEGGDFIFKRKN